MLSGTKLAGGSPDRGRVKNDFYATNPKKDKIENNFHLIGNVHEYEKYAKE